MIMSLLIIGMLCVGGAGPNGPHGPMEFQMNAGGGAGPFQHQLMFGNPDDVFSVLGGDQNWEDSNGEDANGGIHRRDFAPDDVGDQSGPHGPMDGGEDPLDKCGDQGNGGHTPVVPTTLSDIKAMYR